MNNQNSFNPSQGQSGKYCMRCGAPVDANGLCPNCAKQADPQPDFPGQNAQPFSYGQPAQPSTPQQPQGFNYAQQQAYPQYAPKAPAGPNIFTYALDYIKAFFTPDPTATLDKAVNEKQHIWSILGSGSVLLVTLGLFGVILNCINKVYESVYSLIAGFSGIPYLGGAADLSSQLGGVKVKLFFYILLVAAAFFFASAGLDTAFFYFQKKKADYIQNMNVLSTAMLPLAVCGGAAFVLSFIYIPLSVILLVTGTVCKYIMLCDGLKKVSNSDKNPIWYVFGLVAANVVAFGLIAYILWSVIF